MSSTSFMYSLGNNAQNFANNILQAALARQRMRTEPQLLRTKLASQLASIMQGQNYQRQRDIDYQNFQRSLEGTRFQHQQDVAGMNHRYRLEEEGKRTDEAIRRMQELEKLKDAERQRLLSRFDDSMSGYREELDQIKPKLPDRKPGQPFWGDYVEPPGPMMASGPIRAMNWLNKIAGRYQYNDDMEKYNKQLAQWQAKKKELDKIMNRQRLNVEARLYGFPGDAFDKIEESLSFNPFAKSGLFDIATGRK